MTTTSSEYDKMFYDKEYTMVARTLFDSKGGSVPLGTRFPIGNQKNMKVNNYGHDNMIKVLTYNAEIANEPGKVVEIYQKKELGLEV